MLTVYRYWAWLVFAVAVQVGFAGYGAFYTANKVEDSRIDEDNSSTASASTPAWVPRRVASG